jgi:DNA-directed RNA polymerase subunit D
METLENSKDKLVLRMEANEPLANAIRRSLSEIPTLAIDEVEILKNDSALYDEILALRLGLIPLKTEKSMNSKTKINLKLIKKGPCTVYADDLKGPVDIVNKNIPLTILKENNHIELLATATLGTAREHAKHTPGLCYYRHIKEIKSSTQIDKIVEKSNGLIKAQKNGSIWKCDPNDSELNQIENTDKNAISDSDEIIFIIESFGGITAKEILIQSIKALESNLKEFQKEIK